MKYNTATPYAATFVILRRHGKIALLLRQNTKWMNEYYGLPSGKVEWDESPTVAAAREAKEEVGVEIVKDDLRFVHVMYRYHKGTEMSTWADLFFEADKWDGEPFNAEPHMHSELAWLDPADLPENVIPPVRAAIEAIESGQLYSEYGWTE